MRLSLTLYFLLYVIVCKAQVELKYSIQLNTNLIQNTKVRMAHYYGDELTIDTSLKLNEKGEVEFKGTHSLMPGVYAFIFGDEDKTLEILIDSHPFFSIHIDWSTLNDMKYIKFKGSQANDLFYGYKNFLNSLEDRYTSEFHIQKYQDSVIQKYPKSYLSELFQFSRDCFFSSEYKNKVFHTKLDSVNAHRNFILDHEWNGFDFRSNHFTNTPLFNSKLDRYFMTLQYEKTEKINEKINWIMTQVQSNDLMRDLILSKLFYGSLNHDFKWSDDVLVYIYESYIAGKSITWIEDGERKEISEKINSTIAHLKGKPAPNIELPNLHDQNQSLYTLESRYTILIFWDIDCHHCKETLPVIDSLFQKNWKSKGISIYAIGSISQTHKIEWRNYISDHKLHTWTHVYNSDDNISQNKLQGKKSYSEQFNVWSSPSFFLLDQDKRFMAKKLPLKELIELLDKMTY